MITALSLYLCDVTPVFRYASAQCYDTTPKDDCHMYIHTKTDKNDSQKQHLVVIQKEGREGNKLQVLSTYSNSFWS